MWFLRFHLWMPLFLVGHFAYHIDRIVWHAVGHPKRTRYIRQGACQNSGVCCKGIGISLPFTWLKYSWLTGFFKTTYRFLYRFHAIGRRDNMLVFECHHLTPDNRCGIYPFRPSICREYPKTTLAGHADVHRGCGFSFVKRDGSRDFNQVFEDKRDSFQI